VKHLEKKNFNQRVRIARRNGEPLDLDGIDLTDQDLRGLDFASVSGLMSDRLAGSNLKGASLPEDLDFGLKTVEDASKHAGRLFIGLMLACGYCWLTIGATTDPALVLNTAATDAKLPIINAPVPILGFFYGRSMVSFRQAS